MGFFLYMLWFLCNLKNMFYFRYRFMLAKSKKIDYSFLAWDCFLKSCEREKNQY